MERSEALERVSAARVGRFSTVTRTGSPHIVPITYALIGEAVVHMVDHKPKRANALRRIANLTDNPRASLLVDHYDEDWRRLWWVRVDGTGTVVESGHEWDRVRSALVEKYLQYATNPPAGAAIYLTIEGVTSWAYTG